MAWQTSQSKSLLPDCGMIKTATFSLLLFLPLTSGLSPSVAMPSLATVTSQIQNPDVSELLQRILPQSVGAADIDTGVVRLDGYTLFSITASEMQAKQEVLGTLSPVQKRINIIEERLQALAVENLDSKALIVTQEVDSASQLPVLYVNGQELMTVTRQDALLYSSSLEQWTSEVTNIIQEALIRAQKERQPAYLQRQAVLAGGVMLLMLGGGLWITWRKRSLNAQQLADEEQSRLKAEAESAGETTAVTVDPAQRQLQRQHNIRRLRLLLLQIGEVVLYAGGSFRLLGLVPQTRWLQPLILSGAWVPLNILGIGLTTYLLVRISFVLIDRLCAALTKQPFLLPLQWPKAGQRSSKRNALRIATMGSVLRGVSVVVLVSAGALGVLAALSIDVVPLLAGVSVIGLAISFASQSLIKDTINGFLILLEDQYGVGDIIIVGEVSGLVENMNLRITQLRDGEGRLITVPNSMIDIVQNLSKDWSRVDLSIDVDYSANPDQALAVVQQVAADLYCDRNWRREIIETPEVLGIENLTHTGITIRTWIKTVPLSQWNVSREFRRRLKLQLDDAQIEIGIPQQRLITQNGETHFVHPDSSLTHKTNLE